MFSLTQPIHLIWSFIEKTSFDKKKYSLYSYVYSHTHTPMLSSYLCCLNNIYAYNIYFLVNVRLFLIKTCRIFMQH